MEPATAIAETRMDFRAAGCIFTSSVTGRFIGARTVSVSLPGKHIKHLSSWRKKLYCRVAEAVNMAADLCSSLKLVPEIHQKPMMQRNIATKARRAARKPKTQTERREEAMTQILDAAEKLFARHGRSGVTLRALAEEASVDPALVRYYFEDLDGVFRQTFQRKSDIVNAIRIKAMDDYLAKHGDAPTIEGTFDVYLRPVFETIWSAPEEWTNYVAIVAHANSSPFQGRDVMRQAFDAYVSRWVDLLRRLAPEVPAKELFWLHHLMSGSILITLAQTGRVDVLSGGLCDSADMKSAYDSIKHVYCAGFAALRVKYAGMRSEQLQKGKPARKKVAALR